MPVSEKHFVSDAAASFLLKETAPPYGHEYEQVRLETDASLH